MKRLLLINVLIFIYGLINAAVIRELSGSVDILTAGKWQKAQTAMQVNDGDKIMTGISSKVTLDTEGGFFTVNELSLITFHEVKTDTRHDQKLNLETGKVRVRFSRIKGSNATFNVETPRGTASVLGTEEDVGYVSFRGMTVDVIEGIIGVADNNGAGLAAGQGQKGGVSGKGLFGNSDNIYGGLGQNNQFGDADIFNNQFYGSIRGYFNTLINPPAPAGGNYQVPEPQRL